MTAGVVHPGDTVTFTLKSGPQNGTVTVDADGHLTFQAHDRARRVEGFAHQADEAQRARWPRWLHDTGLDALVACHPHWQSALADVAPGPATPEVPR